MDIIFVPILSFVIAVSLAMSWSIFLALSVSLAQPVHLAAAEVLFRNIEFCRLDGAYHSLDFRRMLGKHVLLFSFLVEHVLERCGDRGFVAFLEGLLKGAELYLILFEHLALLLGKLVVNRPENLGLFHRKFHFARKVGDMLAVEDRSVVATFLLLGVCPEDYGSENENCKKPFHDAFLLIV